MTKRRNRKSRKKRSPALAALGVFWWSVKTSVKTLWATLQWWWNLPPWLKWGKIVVGACVLISIPLIDRAQQWWQYRSIYSTYYTHFYDEYIKSTTPYYANYYADYYAKFYADYYSNPSYRRSINNALPSYAEETVTYPVTSPVAKLKVNRQGLSLIKEFEGLELEPYADAGGKLTIGYGHLVRPGEYFGKISENEAHKLLLQDLAVAEAYVKRYVKVRLTEHEFAALTSLVYNIGPTAFYKSTLLKHLNKGNRQLAAKEFLAWNKVAGNEVSGLTRRRQAEKALFES